MKLLMAWKTVSLMLAIVCILGIVSAQEKTRGTSDFQLNEALSQPTKSLIAQAQELSSAPSQPQTSEPPRTKPDWPHVDPAMLESLRNALMASVPPSSYTRAQLKKDAVSLGDGLVGDVWVDWCDVNEPASPRYCIESGSHRKNHAPIYIRIDGNYRDRLPRFLASLRYGDFWIEIFLYENGTIRRVKWPGGIYDAPPWVGPGPTDYDRDVFTKNRIPEQIEAIIGQLVLAVH